VFAHAKEHKRIGQCSDISQFAERLSRECVSIQTIQTAKALHDGVLLQDKLCSPRNMVSGLYDYMHTFTLSTATMLAMVAGMKHHVKP